MTISGEIKNQSIKQIRNEKFIFKNINKTVKTYPGVPYKRFDGFEEFFVSINENPTSTILMIISLLL